MSSSNRRTRYTQEFKEHAIALADDSRKPIGQVEAELGVGRGQISRWRRELSDMQTSTGNDRDLEAENRRLRRETAELREEREILRKAAAIFSQDRK
jgi:transposase